MALPLDAKEASRREFLAKLGLGACALTLAGGALTALDYLEPKVLFEPSTEFKAGNIQDFPDGTVKFDEEHRAYIIGGPGGIFALSAVCTHLGCITRYHADEGVIACPCHGSRFDPEGNVVHGPAPRALPWIEVRADAEGNLTVDTSVVIPHGKVLKV
ncbi:MAG TPA: ubiquinol-cytochrome c reductase iron-sulfur subunit [Geothrix sp.]|nr:ubiquinol-cytochrome c reductase iron-sulfur subunit [Geothrix sp.]